MDQNILVGNTATFSASFTGIPTPTVTWQYSKDHGGTWATFPATRNAQQWRVTSILTTPAAGLGTDGFEFRAQLGSAYNPSAPVNSGAAELHVTGTPTVTVSISPSSGVQDQGSQVVFTANVSGNNTPTYTYLWSGPCVTSATCSSTTPSTLTLSSAQAAAAGPYTVTVTDTSTDANAAQTGNSALTQTASATSSPVSLTVYVPAAVGTSPLDQNILAGHTASFTASFTGTPSPTITWQYSKDHGSTWANFPTPPNNNTPGTSVLTTNAAGVGADGYEFEAVATNAIANSSLPNTATSTPAVLHVTGTPTVTVSINPSSGIQNQGSQVVFTANVSGNNSPSYTYLWSGPCVTSATCSSTTPSTLTLSSAQAAAAGHYTVTVTDTSTDSNAAQTGNSLTTQTASTTSSPVSLTVYVPAAVGTNPTSESILSGSTASFTASFTGNPSPTITWQYSKDGITWAPFPTPPDNSTPAAPQS